MRVEHTEEDKSRIMKALYLLYDSFNRELKPNLAVHLVNETFKFCLPDRVEKVVHRIIQNEQYLPAIAIIYEAVREDMRDYPPLQEKKEPRKPTIDGVLRQDMNDLGCSSLQEYVDYVTLEEQTDCCPYTVMDPQTKEDVRVLDIVKGLCEDDKI